MRWREGLTSHADVMATVLDWAGLRLVNSSTAGTILRRGVSLLLQPTTRHAQITHDQARAPGHPPRDPWKPLNATQRRQRRRRLQQAAGQRFASQPRAVATATATMAAAVAGVGVAREAPLRTAMPVYSFFNPNVCGALLLGNSLDVATSHPAPNTSSPPLSSPLSSSSSSAGLISEIVVDHSRSRLARKVTVSSTSPASFSSSSLSPSWCGGVSSAAACGGGGGGGAATFATTDWGAAPLKQSAAWQRALQQQRVAVRFLYRRVFG